MFEPRYLLHNPKTPSIRGFLLYYKDIFVLKTESDFRFRKPFSNKLDTNLTQKSVKNELFEEILPILVNLALVGDPFLFERVLIDVFHSGRRTPTALFHEIFFRHI